MNGGHNQATMSETDYLTSLVKVEGVVHKEEEEDPANDLILGRGEGGR